MSGKLDPYNDLAERVFSFVIEREDGKDLLTVELNGPVEIYLDDWDMQKFERFVHNVKKNRRSAFDFKVKESPEGSRLDNWTFENGFIIFTSWEDGSRSERIKMVFENRFIDRLIVLDRLIGEFNGIEVEKIYGNGIMYI